MISNTTSEAKDITLSRLSLRGASPSDISKIIADDIEKWVKVAKFAGLKPE